ncbi:Dol-P-Glc:Glc(2)Man(9)GlcNAc(2)-PP-Dol alpha-1,2-glucosyltransferase, partial [Sporobolomyces salmoneus]|uniref:Dol-P-Glc:Glc(2)Man(9)GlcNAc(2)-PP-Dol alpha-1,2-glucosyltransferase n=1 Tax=Sporobolomyces salmoneus TaxID=183962 RepID=UPI00316F8BE2
MSLSSKLYWSVYALWISTLVGVARRINREVTEPYMDEIFHVPQAQAYCSGDWRYWNGAITTPPGLYLLPAVLSNIQRHLPRYFSRFNFCSLDSLRFFNLSILAFLPLLYTSLLLAIRQPVVSEKKQRSRTTIGEERKENGNSARWEGLTIALMPVLGWWGWLYYTDLGSLATVLLSMRLSLDKRWFWSSIVGAISLLFRQTNIVWVAFIAGVGIARELRTGNSSKKTKSQLYDPLLPDARPIDLVLTPYSLAYLSLHNLSALVPILTAYLSVFLGFLAFIKLNRGIVLGDKSNHVATIHIPQIYYFVAFSSVFLSPHLLDSAKIKKTWSSLFGSKTRVATSLNALVVMCWTIRNFTIAHPFLLADNRHFAFYLWRRVLNVHPLARYLLTPLYLVASRLICQAL